VSGPAFARVLPFAPTAMRRYVPLVLTQISPALVRLELLLDQPNERWVPSDHSEAWKIPSTDILERVGAVSETVPAKAFAEWSGGKTKTNSRSRMARRFLFKALRRGWDGLGVYLQKLLPCSALSQKQVIETAQFSQAASNWSLRTILRDQFHSLRHHSDVRFKIDHRQDSC
jgi:hypothetical protein